ncbi:Uncharacterised protein [Mycobacteroides abscessus subsp. abscessus]|nr:Uncharacterised protein [Mycobacteroides abscessus subsp. abscessus]
MLLAAVTRCAQQCSPDRGLVTGIGSHGNVLQRRHLPEKPNVLECAGDATARYLVTTQPA